MKEHLGSRKLDHEYCISRMDIMQKIAYDFIYKDTEFKSKNWVIVIDKFIETCVTYDMLVREHVYYPKR